MHIYCTHAVYIYTCIYNIRRSNEVPGTGLLPYGPSSSSSTAADHQSARDKPLYDPWPARTSHERHCTFAPPLPTPCTSILTPLLPSSYPLHLHPDPPLIPSTLPQPPPLFLTNDHLHCPLLQPLSFPCVPSTLLASAETAVSPRGWAKVQQKVR